MKAFVQLLKSMCRIRVMIQAPQLLDPDEYLYDLLLRFDITGDVNGHILFSYEKKLALRIASILNEEHYTEINSECIDVLKEFSNMICGNSFLFDQSITMDFSIPQVIEGLPSEGDASYQFFIMEAESPHGAAAIMVAFS